VGHVDARFDALRKVADPAVCEVIERAVLTGPDAELFRINVLAWAGKRGLDEDRALDAFVHASKLGLFELAWNVLCPGCGGVLDAMGSLRTTCASYECKLCAGAHEPSLDELIEVVFTVSAGVRRIAQHQPDALSPIDYFRQMYFSGATALPDGDRWLADLGEFMLEAEEVPARQRLVLSVTLPPGPMVVIDAVSHNTVGLMIEGEPTRERQELSLVYDETAVTPVRAALRPGAARIVIENRTTRRTLPALYVVNERFNRLLKTRQPFVTARRLFTNQTFRDVYRAGTLEIDQRLKLTSLTVLFTDLYGSTALYERVGDLTAYDMVRAHFGVLTEVVRKHHGAVVKTIGDAVMATFDAPADGFAAALEMRDSMDALNARREHEDLLVKIGLHEGPCLAVTSNDRLDYFGQTVNIAARVQGIAEARGILATESIIGDDKVAGLLRDAGLSPVSKRTPLKGISEEVTVFEIPPRATS
jgi:class 3 adenylate cyclase